MFTDESTAGYAVAQAVGGQWFANVVNVATLVGGFASCVAIQASTSRLMFVMGRDGVLPRRVFGYLHPRYRTPLFNLLLIGAAGMFAMWLSLETATSFINFGAFLAFTVVNICVITRRAAAGAAGVRPRCRRGVDRPLSAPVRARPAAVSTPPRSTAGRCPRPMRRSEGRRAVRRGPAAQSVAATPAQGMMIVGGSGSPVNPLVFE